MNWEANMHTLTAMTLAALALGGATYAVDTAAAQAPAQSCAERTVDIYFEQGKSGVTTHAEAVVARVAKEVNACPGSEVTAITPAGALSQERATSLVKLFDRMGVDAHLIGARPLPVGMTSMEQRVASIRIAPPVQEIG
jgi:hypothetical protein